MRLVDRRSLDCWSIALFEADSAGRRCAENRSCVLCYTWCSVSARHAVKLCLAHRVPGLGRRMCKWIKPSLGGCNMLGRIAKVGSTVQWVPSQRHARGSHVTSGVGEMPERAWALHCTTHCAAIAQGPRSLCHKLTYPLLLRDGERPAKAWAPKALHGDASQSIPAPGGQHWMLWSVQLSKSRIVQSPRERKICALSRCRRGCYIHSDDCAGRVAPLAMDRPCLGPYPAAAARDDRLWMCD
jgi:hypothetical protein